MFRPSTFIQCEVVYEQSLICDLEYSVDPYATRQTVKPESRADRHRDRPGSISAFVQQPFQVPPQFRSQIGFDSDELTGFKAPFGESGSGTFSAMF